MRILRLDARCRRFGLRISESVISVTCDLAPAESPRVGMILRNENRMISTLKKLQAKKAVQESNGGFTLIELLIVIVVLGILAAVVVFSLGSVTGSSAVAACQADGATVETAIAAYNAQNSTGTPDATNLVTQGYLVSFPNNATHYLFAMDAGKLYLAPPATTGTPASNAAGWTAWTGSGTCVLNTTVK